MWWLLPVATALMSAKRAERQAEQKKQYNLGQAEITRYSPWTGKFGQLDHSYSPSTLEGAVGGAVQGLGIVQGFGGKLGGANKPEASADYYNMEHEYGSSAGDEPNSGWATNQLTSPWSMNYKRRSNGLS